MCKSFYLGFLSQRAKTPELCSGVESAKHYAKKYPAPTCRGCAGILLILSMMYILSCKDTIRRSPDSSGAVVISWEFKNILKEGESFTDAVIVLHGAAVKKYPLGLFYGATAEVLKPGMKTKELEGGTLSGFITDTGGRGTEVLVRHDEHLGRLIVLTRNFFPGSPRAAFKTHLIIRIGRPERPDTGF